MNSEFNQTYDESAAYNNRGIKKGELGDYSGAIDDLKMAIKLNPKREKAYNNLGTIKATKGDHSGAIDEYTMAIKLNPNYIKAYKERGYVKYRLGFYESSCEEYKKIIRLGELEKKIGLCGSNACKYLKNSKRGYFDMR